ncbi:MAG: class I adenylate-forming enzyme family protein [Acutalibacteraceae bacterium]
MINSIVEAIKNNSISQPDKICLTDAKGQITYSEYYNLICKKATFLVKEGIKKGDKVIIKTSQSIEFLSTLHAVHLIGAIAVPLEKTVKSERVLEINSLVEAKCYFADKAVELDGVKIYTFSDFDLKIEPEQFNKLPNREDESTILFTTGTTGKSKGILMAHCADVAVAENVKFGTEMKKDNVEVLPMPFNHSFSLRRYYANMINGSSAVLLDGVIFINKFFEAFDKYSATSAGMAPSALSIIFRLSDDKISEYKDKIDYIQFGSSYMTDADKQRIRELLPNTRLYNFYGSTEAGCSSIIDFNRDNINPYDIGKPTVNSDIKFVDEDGNFVETDIDNPARLVTGGGMIMNEYYKEPELTSEILIDGYIYSNDLGYYDENGDIIMLGRMDDVIISGGQKISPFDIEDVCIKYEGVDDCAVIGVDDAVMGQIAKLFIVVNDSYNENELVKFLSERLENFQIPKVIRIIDKIPKTYNGKALKRELKKID